MHYGSVCSGIEAASVAWDGLGWGPSFFSEIDPFARAVLQHRFPDVPLHGDFTTIQDGDYAPIDLLVGGTPCQSFSVAGLRGGMDDARGNLSFEFIRLARRLKPRYIVWENVPGVLSSNGGRDFGSFLGALVECGFGVAYRVLDARFFNLPQRRARVFVVGCTGADVRRAEEILFDGDGVCRHSHARRKKGEIAPTLPSRSSAGGGFGTDFDCDGGLIAHTLRGESFDGSEDGTGRGTPLVPVLYRTNAKGQVQAQGDVSAALTTSTDPCAQILAFDAKQVTSATNRSNPKPGDPCHTLVAHTLVVRRLLPVETERLQGFPDGHTDVPYRGKSAADGPRYKSIGNSMAVPVMRWIGERIHTVEHRAS